MAPASLPKKETHFPTPFQPQRFRCDFLVSGRVIIIPRCCLVGCSDLRTTSSFPLEFGAIFHLSCTLPEFKNLSPENGTKRNRRFSPNLEKHIIFWFHSFNLGSGKTPRSQAVVPKFAMRRHCLEIGRLEKHADAYVYICIICVLLIFRQYKEYRYIIFIYRHMHELYRYSIYIALCIYPTKLMQSIDLKSLGHSTTKGVIFKVEVHGANTNSIEFCLPSIYLSIFNPHRLEVHLFS